MVQAKTIIIGFGVLVLGLMTGLVGRITPSASSTSRPRSPDMDGGSITDTVKSGADVTRTIILKGSEPGAGVEGSVSGEIIGAGTPEGNATLESLDELGKRTFDFALGGAADAFRFTGDSVTIRNPTDKELESVNAFVLIDGEKRFLGSVGAGTERTFNFG